MDRRIIGVSFFLVSAILYCSIYVTAGSMVQGDISNEIFSQYVTYVPKSLKYLSLTTALLGIIYFVWGEIESFKK